MRKTIKWTKNPRRNSQTITTLLKRSCKEDVSKENKYLSNAISFR